MARREQLFDAQKEPILHTAEMGYKAFIEAPPGNDPTIRALGYAGINLLLKPYYQNFLTTNLSKRTGIPVAHLGGINRGIYQEAVLHPYLKDRTDFREGAVYNKIHDPYKFTRSPDPFAEQRDPHEIEEFIEAYLNSKVGNDLAGLHLREHNVPTTTIGRYGLPMIISTILQVELSNRIRKDLRVADIGSSLTHGLKWWAMQDFFRSSSRITDPMAFSMKKPRASKDGETIEYIGDGAATRHMHTIGKNAAALALGVGGDIMPINERDVIRFGESMFYPQEYVVKAGNDKLSKFEEFHLLTEMRPNTVKFVQDDYTNLDFDKFYRKLGLSSPSDKHFDVVMALTMMYELTPQQQESILKTMFELAGDNGIVILQDAARIDPNDPTKFITDSDSFGTPWQVRTYLIDPRNPVLQEWFVAKSGRLTEIAFGKHFGMLGGKPVPGLREQFGLAA